MKKLVYSSNYDRRRINDYMSSHDMYPQYYRISHGFGPGTVPDDVKIVDHYEDDVYDYVAFDRTLTSDEISYYDLRPVSATLLAELGIGPYYYKRR